MTESQNKPKRKWKHIVGKIFGFVFLYLVVAFALLNVCLIINISVKKDIEFFGYSVIWVDTDKVYPPIKEGDLCYYKVQNSDVKTGDVVIVYHQGTYLIERVDSISGTKCCVSNNEESLEVLTAEIVGVYCGSLPLLGSMFKALDSEYTIIGIIVVALILVTICELYIHKMDKKEKQGSNSTNQDNSNGSKARRRITDKETVIPTMPTGPPKRPVRKPKVENEKSQVSADNVQSNNQGTGPPQVSATGPPKTSATGTPKTSSTGPPRIAEISGNVNKSPQRRIPEPVKKRSVLNSASVKGSGTAEPKQLARRTRDTTK